MSPLPPWDALLRGEGCPFCAPRPDNNAHHDKIAVLSISTLYLSRNQTYRGYCTLIFDPRHATGIEHLDEAEYDAFTRDLRRASLAVNDATTPDMMNYATLGNVIPHLHYHLIPRYKADPRWGLPIWESDLVAMPVTTLATADFDALREKIADTLGRACA